MLFKVKCSAKKIEKIPCPAEKGKKASKIKQKKLHSFSIIKMYAK